jgi:hypothetical protein
MINLNFAEEVGVLTPELGNHTIMDYHNLASKELIFMNPCTHCSINILSKLAASQGLGLLATGIKSASKGSVYHAG